MSVAAILTCYNEGEFIEAAVASVRAQGPGGRVGEIVLVDDGSARATLEVLDRMEAAGGEPRLTVLRGPGGWGLGGARNRAVALSSAPLLAFLDGDDAWAPDKLARQHAAMAADPGVGLVYTGYEALAAGAQTGPAVGVYDLSTFPQPVRRYFLHDPPILPSSVLMRRSLFDAVHGFDEHERVFCDTDFLLKVLPLSRIKGLAEPLIKKRYRAGSLSAPRPELMANHASVAFLAAARDPGLAPLVPQRLAERAARLGLVAYYADDLEVARGLAAVAGAMQPLNLRARVLGALLLGGKPLRRALAPRLASRKRLHER